MSDKLIADSQAEKKPGPAPSGFRSKWIATGLILWILVFVAAMALIRKKRAGGEPGEAARPAITREIDLQGTESQKPDLNSLDSAKAPPNNQSEVKVPWNPAGIDDFTFTERSGRKITKADLLGHPWLVSFIFTRCAGPCPKISIQMSELQQLLKGTDVRLVTLTVDPDFDTTEVLNRYAQMFHADPNRWLFLTGDKRKTYELINNSFLMPVMETRGKDREPGFEVLHSTNILLVNEKGIVVGKYDARYDVNIARLRNDLKAYTNKNHPQHDAADKSLSNKTAPTVKQGTPH
jgi:protein SCO1